MTPTEAELLRAVQDTVIRALTSPKAGLSAFQSVDVFAALFAMSAPDRLALARALVADMPGVVVAQVPDAWLVPAEKNTPYNKGRRRGWNDFRTAIITAGSATDGR